MAQLLNLLHHTKLDKLPFGKHSDGGGLYLYKLAGGTSQWVFRFTWLGKRHEMGLGGWPALPISQARAAAEHHRSVLRSGENPKDRRNAERERAKTHAAASDPEALNRQRLRTIAPLAFEARKKELKDDGKAGRWFSPLKTHVLPVLGVKPVSEIDGNAIAEALKPIWHKHPDVARKAITRLDACLRYARASGIKVDRNAVADARELLGKQVHTATPIPAMDWRDVPEFYASIDGGSVVLLALRLLILTGVRSKPLRFIHLDQIKGNVWTIPGDQMKGMKGKTDDFRVPLSDEAWAIIEEASDRAREGFLFPNEQKGVVRDASMARHMERKGLVARPHGFRSSFRTWADEQTITAYEVKEAALAHKVGSSVSRAYLRTDYFDERAQLGQAWSSFVIQKPAAVTQLYERG
jgi:integrase